MMLANGHRALDCRPEVHDAYKAGRALASRDGRPYESYGASVAPADPRHS